MRELTSLESKKIILDILIYFDKVCRNHNLHYTLAYGTLLGAVRHQGFIPWDDDVDVEMPLEDYRKFISIMTSINDRYKLHSRNTEAQFGDNYYYPFAKLEDSYTKIDFLKTNDSGGAFIDIFPMTPLPNSRKMWWLYNKEARLLKVTLAILNGKNRSKFRNTLSLITNKIIDYRSIRDRLWHLAIKYENSDSEYLVDGTWHDYKNKNYFPRSWFKNYTELDFESYGLSVISEYKKMLRHDYGNWEKMPPKKDRISHHSYRLYIKE